MPEEPKQEATPIIHLTDHCSPREYKVEAEGAHCSYWLARNIPNDSSKGWKAFARYDIGKQHYSASDEREHIDENFAWKVAQLLASALAEIEKKYLQHG